MVPPPSSHAQSRPSGQSSAPPNPSNASGQSYEERGRVRPAYPPYGQTHPDSEFGLSRLRKPLPGEFSYRSNPPTNAPPISQPMLRVQQKVDPSSYSSGTRLGGFTQEASVSAPIVEGALSESDRDGLISAMHRPHMSYLLTELYEGTLSEDKIEATERVLHQLALDGRKQSRKNWLKRVGPIPNRDLKVEQFLSKAGEKLLAVQQEAGYVPRKYKPVKRLGPSEDKPSQGFRSQSRHSNRTSSASSSQSRPSHRR